MTDNATGAVNPPYPHDEFWDSLVRHRHDIEALMLVIAEQVVDLFGDGCVITTVGSDGTTLQPRAVVHADPEVESAMRAVLSSSEARIGEGIAGTAAADRRSIVLSGLEPETVAETTPSQFLAFVRDHPMRSIAVVPLLSGGELVGTLGSVRTSSDTPYSLDDVRRLEGLAELASRAVEEALAYDGPSVIDFHIDPDANVYPMVASGAPNGKFALSEDQL